MKISCFLKYNTLTYEELTRAWLKILNPLSLELLAKAELKDLFERFSRGKMLAKKILVSATFSENMIELLEREGCENVDDPREILMSKVAEKIGDGTFHIELFN